MARSTPAPELYSQPARTGLWTGALVVLGAAGAAALLREYGFRDGGGPIGRNTLHLLELVVAAAFVLDWAGRLAIARDRRAFLAGAWGEAAMAGAALAVGGAGWRAEVAGVGPVCVLSLQAYLACVILVRLSSVRLGPVVDRIGLPLAAISGGVLLCLAGAGLLMLPVATPEQTSAQFKPLFFPDALFTAVSAACDAGLTVRDTGPQFTTVGHVIILVLVQLGGLGVMLLGAALAVSLGIGRSGRAGRELPTIAGEPGGSPGARSGWQLGRLAKLIVVTTFAVEALGAVLMYPLFAGLPGADGRPLSAAAALWYSAFHSVSAFCNAGFSLYGRNLLAGVNQAGWANPLREHWQVLGVMAPLIVLGGVGLPVLTDCGGFLLAWARRLRLVGDGRGEPGRDGEKAGRPTLTAHSHVALWMTGMLIFGGALGLVAVEPSPGGPAPSQSRHPVGGGGGEGGDWERMQVPHRVRQAIFESASARTAGFSTLDVEELSDAGKLWLCGLMLVGGSPGGTAGGMKTVTVYLLAALVWSFLRRREDVEADGRAVSRGVLRKAVSAAALYLGLVALVTLGLTILMRPGYSFLDLFFEACSACGAVGLSTGVTPSLSEPAKGVVMGGMFVGRLGLVCLFLTMTGRTRATTGQDPTEDLLIA